MKLALNLVLCSLLFLASCTRKKPNSNYEIQQIIVEHYEKMRTTLKNGDPEYVINMHTNDAILFLLTGKEVVGIDELRPFYEKVAASEIDIKSIPTSIELLAENVVYEVGTFTSTSKAGTKTSSKYINIWKKVEGDWKIFKAIDQSLL